MVVNYSSFGAGILRPDSGAGTILGQGGQDQRLPREIRFFSEIGLLYAETTSVLQQKKRSSPEMECLFLGQIPAFSKKKKRSSPNTECLFNPIVSVLWRKLAQNKSLRGGKVVQGGPKCLQGGRPPPLLPHFPRLCAQKTDIYVQCALAGPSLTSLQAGCKIKAIFKKCSTEDHRFYS